MSRAATDTNASHGVADYSMAGDYYLAVSMGREDVSVEFPLTIELEVVGARQPGPTYADDASWTVADGATVPEATGDPSPLSGSSPDDESAEQPDASDRDDGSTVPVAGIIVGTAGALALLATILLRKRRRS